MGLLILLFIIGLPLIEIYSFIAVGNQVGALSTIGLTVLTAAIGMMLVRAQGMGVVRRAEQNMAQGDTPIREALEGVALLLAGVFLLIPGFFTDALGALLLIPFVRNLIGLAILSRVFIMRSKRQGGGFTVEAEFEDITPRSNDGEPPTSLPPKH